MSNIFSSVKIPKVKKSTFNLSHERKLSGNFGSLMPVLCEEALPGDAFKINTELLIKMAPLKAPVMHRLNATVHYFFVPTYQIWDKFEDFINPATTQETVPPYLDIETVFCHMLANYLTAQGQSGAGFTYVYYKVHNQSATWAQLKTAYNKIGTHTGIDFIIGSLMDYFGLDLSALYDACIANDSTACSTILAGLDPKISSLPFRAYAHIWNEYYRDENLMSEIDYVTEDGSNGADAKTLQLLDICYRCWKKDYFTSALPSPQAGDDVLLPIGQEAPVRFDAGEHTVLGSLGLDYSGTPTSPYVQDELVEPSQKVSVNAKADLRGVTGVSISELRKSVALQQFKELAQRGGKTRYKQLVWSLFNAFLPDYYIDRPIFLGGQKQPIAIGEVVQTSMSVEEGGNVAALGTRAGLAQSFGRTKTVFTKFPCHGYIIGLLSIRPEATYQQGIHRMWTRRSLFDYAFPQFAHIGEQEIYNRELCFSQSKEYNDGVFGYTPRYAEYKCGESVVCGQFRKSLDYWHFGRTFNNDGTNSPKLNAQFVQMSPDQMDYDPFAVTDNKVEHVYIDLYNHITARRPLPYFGTPKLI